jgi:hypothetical protein
VTRFRRRLAAGAVGAVALAGGAIGGVYAPEAFFRAWLAGFAGITGLSLGALMLLLAHDLTGGAWGEAVRRPLAALTALMPPAALAILPVLFGMRRLYPWAQPGWSGPGGQGFYLDPGFFIARAVVYFAIWVGLAWLVLRAEPDRPPNPAGTPAWSAPGLIALAVTATFSAFDWTMSLDPRFPSSIYGLFVTASDLVGALALATLAVAFGLPERRLRGDLASLLFAGILLWAYLALMQFVIVWEEDLPDETGWYLHRLAQGWTVVDIGLALLAVALPGAILLLWPLKSRPSWLAAACALLLAGYVLTQWWLAVPPLPLGWIVVAVMLGIGAFWWAVFDWRLERGYFLRRGSGTVTSQSHV